MSDGSTTTGLQGIAIIGMSGRFPGSSDLDEYWQNLRQGVEGIRHFSREELEAAGVDPRVADHPDYVRRSGHVGGFENFDAKFFDFNPGEARILDPHHRLFLEHAWQALENAGYDSFSYPGVIGAYGGMGGLFYLMDHLLPDPEVLRTASPLQLRIYNDKDFLASLTAFKLNLQGPSATVQTACATSLVSTCLACQSLLSYQCDIALSGGVALSPPGYFAHEGVFSPDGHCRAFDARAEGTVAGSGVGVVALKRLEQALEDGDTIHAVIRGWAFNNDGAMKVGYTAPNVDGQAEAIAMAQAMAGVEAETITYIETHGTGTPLGDQVEVAALTDVFRETTDRRGFCALGSVKTNIGHLDAAGGVAGLIKTTLAIEHGFLPPSLHYETANPQIDFESSPFYVQARGEEWAVDGPRRAGISAFAVGGVNAHLVLEQAPTARPSGPSRAWQLVPISARDEDALEQATERLVDCLKDRPVDDLPDVAYTLQVGRRACEHRRLAVCRNLSDAVTVLEARDPRRLTGGVVREAGRPVVFLFPGLGNHYIGMARHLYREEAVFRRELDLCAVGLEAHLDVDIRTLLYPAEISATEQGGGMAAMLGRAGDEDPAGELVHTRLAQPVLFAVEYALARQLMAWGIEPEAMCGYSVGEYVAACLAGVFELEDGLALVAERARMIDLLPTGAMVAVSLAEDEIQPLLGDDLSITAINGPRVTVVGGAPQAVDALVDRLEKQGETCRRLATTHAFHSHMMASIVESFRARVAQLELRAPRVPFVSNVSGDWITAEQATDPSYWAEHLQQPVRYADAVEVLWQEDHRILLEVGPGGTMASWALQMSEGDSARTAFSCLRHVYEPEDDQKILLCAVGRLWLAGADIQWDAFAAGEQRHRVALPTYPFQRQRFWVEAGRRQLDGRAEVSATSTPVAGEGENPRKVDDIGRWFYLPSWKPELGMQTRRELAVEKSLSDEEPRDKEPWLLFIDPQGIGLQLAKRLEEAGHSVVLVAAGDRFEKVYRGAYILDPATREGYVELLQDLRADGLNVKRIVHGWTVGECSEPGMMLDRGLHSLVFLVQALNTWPETRGLVVLSSHLHQITGNDEVDPERALISGPCSVAPFEYPDLSCRSIEIALPSSDSALEKRLVDRLYLELSAEGDQESPIAFRGATCWTRDYEPVELPATEADTSRIREHGVYLITGGLGGLGLVIAEDLARNVGARLVLVGRSEFPVERSRQSWLEEHPPSDPVSRKIRQVEALEQLGAEVLVVSADVSNLDAVRQVRKLVHERFGPIDGLVHAAGISPGGLMEVKTREQLATVLAPKTEGTRCLYEVFGKDQPDFLMLCSSLTAATGAFGLVDHTAANAYLDAFSQALVTEGTIPTISVGWDAWLEVGQAAAVAAGYGLTRGYDEEILSRPAHPLLDACVYDSGERIAYRTQLSAEGHWLVEEHRLGEFGVMPGTGHLEFVRAAWEDHFGSDPIDLEQVVFKSPLLVAAGTSVEVHLEFQQRQDGEVFDFVLESRPESGGSWVGHVEGQVRSTPKEATPQGFDLAAIRERLGAFSEIGAELAADDASSDESASFTFGPRWQHPRMELHSGEKEGLLTLELDPQFADDSDAYGLHPALLDNATGVLQRLAGGRNFLPFVYGRLRNWRPLPAVVHSYLRFERVEEDAETLAGDIVLLDDAGEVVAEIEAFTMRRIDPSAVGENALAESSGVEAPSGSEQLIGIRPAEGAEVFHRLLGPIDLPPQVLVSTLPIPGRWRAMSAAVPEDHLAARLDLASSASAKNHPRPELATEFVAPRNTTEERIATVFCDLLSLDRVGIHDSFFDLGGDSLLATRLVGLMEERFDVKLSLRVIFESSTVSELALTVVELQSDNLDEVELSQALEELRSLSPEAVKQLLLDE